MSHAKRAKGFEENAIAAILGLMVVVTFVNVILRYVFNASLIWGLEVTLILFAWLVIFGISYAVKTTIHLGVDAFIRRLPGPSMRVLAVFGALAGALYAIILLYSDWLGVFGVGAKGGALDYIAKMFKAGVGLEDLRFPSWIYEPLGMAKLWENIKQRARLGRNPGGASPAHPAA